MSLIVWIGRNIIIENCLPFIFRAMKNYRVATFIIMMGIENNCNLPAMLAWNLRSWFHPAMHLPSPSCHHLKK